MTQNTSHAVMAQRSEPHNSLDDFPTPPWATRALMEALDLPRETQVWEPAANRGYMADTLREYVDDVRATDVHDYGRGWPKIDFLVKGEPLTRPQWVITNPPFKLAQQFVERGREVAYEGVAVLVRSVWAEGIGRFETLFRDNQPTWILQFTERVPMVKGRYDPKASTATSYAWFIWDFWGGDGTQFGWIPPCRKRLERPDDIGQQP